MTHPPPPDPLWPPSLPLPDPLLTPPAHQPWEVPWRPPEPPMSGRPDPPPRSPRPTPARPTVGFTAPSRPRTAPPRAASTPPSRSGPIPPKRWNGLIIGIVGAVLLLCVVSMATGVNLGQRGIEGQPATIASPTPRPRTASSPSFSAPVATVDGGAATSFHLPVGTAVRFTDQDGTWAVALLGIEWIDECRGALGDAVPAVVFDIQYEVTQGAVSIIPLTDFTFVLANGTKAKVGILSACAEPPLDYTIVSAGAGHRGRIAIELPSGTDGVSGELTYGQLVEPTASWTVPARV